MEKICDCLVDEEAGVEAVCEQAAYTKPVLEESSELVSYCAIDISL